MKALQIHSVQLQIAAYRYSYRVDLIKCYMVTNLIRGDGIDSTVVVILGDLLGKLLFRS